MAATLTALLATHARQAGIEDSFHEAQGKALESIESGCIAVLVLDPGNRTATICRGRGQAHVHGESDTIDLSDAVPRFSVRVAELFT